MIKRVSVCWLHEGTDPDELWKYHTEVHTADLIRIAGPRLKKYVVNRVVKVVYGTPTFFDLTELWWENEDDMNQVFNVDMHTMKLANGKTVGEDFWSRVAGGFTMIVDEYIAKE